MKVFTTKVTLASMLGVVAMFYSVRLEAQTPPVIDVERLDGSALSIKNFREHRATVLVFLSSRSPESVAATESIRKLNDLYRRRRVMFAGVFPNPAESGDEIRDFCQASGFVFPCYRDSKQRAAKKLAAQVTP